MSVNEMMVRVSPVISLEDYLEGQSSETSSNSSRINSLKATLKMKEKVNSCW